MKKFYHFLLLMSFGVLNTPAFAQKSIYIGKINDIAATYKKIAHDAGNNSMTLKGHIGHSLPGQLPLTLELNYSKKEGLADYFYGEVSNTKYSNFFLKITGREASGSIIMREQKKFYRYSSTIDGSVYLIEEDIDKVLCIGVPEVQKTNDQKEQKEISEAEASQTGTVAAAAPDLQSLPGAGAVLYLDFNGQTVTNTLWNSNFNGGNPIDAAPANVTEAEMTEIWKLLSEDYRPFALNVTTSEAVFNSVPVNRRMRIIFTPTNYWYPNAGGVAYIGSFTWGTSQGAEHPCWVFNTGIKGAGEAAVHEGGHTLNLAHDGRTSPAESYFQGQGDWAPIMGVGYYKSQVQWSKGEYPYADNTEDDLNKISTLNGFGYRPDDHGNSSGAATPLVFDANGDLSAANNKGVITTRTDVDVFSFTTGGGTVGFNVNPDPGYPNLDILLTLTNSAGTIVATADPSTMAASLNVNVAAGTYYLTIDGTTGTLGANTDYASTGAYSISSINYCLPVYSIGCSNADFINNFSFNTLVNNNSGCSNGSATGYTNYAPGGTPTTSINRGQSYSMSMQSGSSHSQGFGVWIDYNKDKDFDDAGEFVYASPSYSTGVFTTNITIPGTATLGTTRMRVRCKYNGTVTSTESCSSMQYGEAEDYTITIASTNQSPTVSITSPANGATFTAPATINIAATASDADGSVSKVEFFNGSTKMGEDLSAPYDYSWTGVASGSYSITAKATDNVGSITTSAAVSVTVNSTTTACTATGSILREYWANISGNSISAIPVSTTPTSTSQLTSFEAPTDMADNYGQRIRGYMCVPVSGSYTFYIAGDDESELWLSTSDNPAAKQKIAFVTDWTNSREWTKFGSQKSAAIALQANTKYYVEALQKEGGGGDNLAVGWITPGASAITVIPGSVLSPVTGTTNSAPTVSITSPANGATFTAPATINIAATASDADGSVSKVEFFNGSTKMGEDLSAPYDYSWTGVAPGSYSITAKATDNVGSITTSAAVSVTVNSTTTACTATGSILREYWANISGNSISAIPVSTTPASTSQLTSFEAPTDMADNYGQRIRGYMCVPVSGSYTFYIAGDDESELWLSTSDNPAAKQKIAFVTDWTNSREWTKFGSQKSAAIALQANTKYYVEALQKEGGGGDNLAVGWITPGASAITVIPGSVLSPVTGTTNSAPTTSALYKTKEPVAEVKSRRLSLKALPNPSNTYFTLIIQSSKGEAIDVKVMDATGRVIETKRKVSANGTLQIGYNYRPGIYYLEVVQGSERVTLKLIKGRYY